jgi:hypothetical protein
MSTRSTKGGQYKEIFEGTRAYEVGRARVYLKGKVLAIAAHLDSGRVYAGANLRQCDDKGKETAKNNIIEIARELAELPITSSSKQ